MQSRDEFYTPPDLWEKITHLIPRDKVIWEAFPGNGKSTTKLRELGFTVVSNPGEDFFEHNHGDIVVSNPPYSKKQEVLQRLYDLDKPFILLLPAHSFFNQYMEKFDEHMSLVTPRYRIQFESDYEVKRRKCPYVSSFFCWKMGVSEKFTRID